MNSELMFNMTIYMLSHGKVKASTLASHFDVSKKTIYRYLDRLSLAGVPIVSEIGANGGSRILSSFNINNLYLNKTELAHIFSLASDMPTLKNSGIIDKFTPSSEFSNEITDICLEIIIADSNWQNIKVSDSLTKNILSAIESKITLEIVYNGEKRTISPYSIILKEGNYYLYAYSHNKMANRLFKISRIESAKFIDSNYIKNTLTREEIIKSLENSFEDIEVELITKPKNTDKLSEIMQILDVSKKDDTCLVRAKTKNTSDLALKLMEFEDEVTIVSPTWLKEKIVAICTKVKSCYKKNIGHSLY